MKCWKVSTRIHFLLKSIMPYYFKKQIYKRNHSQQCRKVPVTWVSTVKVLMNIFTNWLNLKSQQFGISFVRSCYDLKCSEHYRMIPNADSAFSWRLLTVGCKTIILGWLPGCATLWDWLNHDPPRTILINWNSGQKYYVLLGNRL